MVLAADLTLTRIPVPDESYVGTARRTVQELAQAAGFSGEPLDRLNIVTSELATNLAKYATNGGDLVFARLACCGLETVAVRIWAIDNGPGISCISTAMKDGHSNGNTLGAGLGSLRRLSDLFEISSTPGKGTVVVCTIAMSDEAFRKTESLDIGFICLPHPREDRSGDAVAVHRNCHSATLLVLDALGHGQDAADVGQKAVEVFRSNPVLELPQLAQEINARLCGSRGAAMALVRVNQQTNTCEFTGIGNISGRIYSNHESTGMLSSQGIVGCFSRKLQCTSYPWPPGSNMLLFSDGLKTCASLEAGRLHKSAALLAGEVYRDYCRHSDDTSAVVIRDMRGL